MFTDKRRWSKKDENYQLNLVFIRVNLWLKLNLILPDYLNRINLSKNRLFPFPFCV
jgi:hypothetical protein